MVTLSRLFRDYAESGSFSGLVNLAGTADDYAFITKSGDLVVALSFVGIDPECLDAQTLDAFRARYRSALRVFDERFLVNTYMLKRCSPPLDCHQGKNEVANEAANARHTYLTGKAASLYSFDAFLTVAIRPNWRQALSYSGQHSVRNFLDAVRVRFGLGRQVRNLDSEVARSLRALHQATKSFLEQTADCLDARLLSVEEAFVFFRQLLNPDPAKAAAISLCHDARLDYSLVDSELEGYRDHLRLDDYFIKTLTLKCLPSRTFANMFEGLRKIKADLVFVTEWRALESNKALAHIRSRRRHAHNTKLSLYSQLGAERPYERELLFDESKEAIVADLGECLKAIQMQGVQLGEFSLTVVIYASSLAEAERAAAEVMKVFGVHDGSLNEERYNGLNAFLATLPAGFPYNLRKQAVTNENHADMVCWFQPAVGEKNNAHLGAPYLAAFETEDKSLFFFNLHVQDVPHTLVLGSTGSGKSFLLNFLIAHGQQYNPATFILDVGGSYRWLTKLFGGSYVEFRPERRSFSINVFCLEPTPSNLDFIFAFVRLLVESGEYRMGDAEQRELFEAIQALYILDPNERNLSTLSTTVSPRIGSHLKLWTTGGQYGEWFDNVADTVTLARFQCIDFEGMDRLGAVLEPLLFYLLHRIDAAVQDPALGTAFKIAVVDEAWLFLKHPVTRAYIASAMRTWRKKNAAMILSTQSLSDLSGTDAFRSVIESCATKLLLANPALDTAFYSDVLRLNQVEINKVRGLAPKRQFVLKREGLSKVLNLNVDPRSYWLFTTNPYEAKRRQELVDEMGLTATLDTLCGGRQ